VFDGGPASGALVGLGVGTATVARAACTSARRIMVAEEDDPVPLGAGEANAVEASRRRLSVVRMVLETIFKNDERGEIDE